MNRFACLLLLLPISALAQSFSSDAPRAHESLPPKFFELKRERESVGFAGPISILGVGVGLTLTGAALGASVNDWRGGAPFLAVGGGLAFWGAMLLTARMLHVSAIDAEIAALLEPSRQRFAGR